jgi:hypothetical protein
VARYLVPAGIYIKKTTVYFFRLDWLALDSSGSVVFFRSIVK